MPPKKARTAKRRCAKRLAKKPAPRLRKSKRYTFELPGQPDPVTVRTSPSGLVFRSRYHRTVFPLTWVEAHKEAVRLKDTPLLSQKEVAEVTISRKEAA